MPTAGPVKHEDKQNNPSVEHDNGWSSALVPFAAGAAGMMLINSLNKKNPGQINNNTNHTYRPPMTQNLYQKYRKKREGKGEGQVQVLLQVVEVQIILLLQIKVTRIKVTHLHRKQLIQLNHQNHLQQARLLVVLVVSEMQKLQLDLNL